MNPWVSSINFDTVLNVLNVMREVVAYMHLPIFLMISSS